MTASKQDSDLLFLIEQVRKNPKKVSGGKKLQIFQPIFHLL
jgi:hypothetical protein